MPRKKAETVPKLAKRSRTAPALTTEPVIKTHKSSNRSVTVLSRDESGANTVTTTPLLTSHHNKPLTAPLLIPVTDDAEPKKPAKPETTTAVVSDLPEAPSIDELAARRSNRLTRDLATPATDEEPAEPEPAAEPEVAIADKPTPPEPAVHRELKLEPPKQEAAEPKPEPTHEATETEEKPEAKPAEAKPATAPEKPADVPAKDKPLAEIKSETKASIEALVESKKYFLPINAVEKRKARQFVIAGIFLSVLLLALWVTIALDAQLITVPGVKPYTHFFSS